MTAAVFPLVLFGACDRHNLGDLLFPHLVAALLPAAAVRVAGLVARDLRAWGGHRVRPLADITASLVEPYTLVHMGGELLTCSLLDAALMLAAPGEVPTAAERVAPWAQNLVGGPWPAPYVAGRERAPRAASLAHVAVGGVALDQAEPALDAAVTAALREADWVSVRDAATQAALARRGVASTLLPDSAVLVRELFGARIAAHARQGEPARVRQAFPEGWIALQFSLDFADDASLAALARMCGRLARSTGLPLVLFRAGAAPLHDDLGLYRRLSQRVTPGVTLRIFESLNIWDICAVIAQSRGFLGSSLHGRIVALAYGLPRVSLVSDTRLPGKQGAFVETWEDAAMPGVVASDTAAEAMLAALAVPRQTAEETAQRLVGLYRAGCAGWLRLPASAP